MSRGVVIHDRLGEAGEEASPDGANGADGENPIEQVERFGFSHGFASVVAYITAQR